MRTCNILAVILLALTSTVFSKENTLTLVVGFAPGGTTWVAARQIADEVMRTSSFQVVVVAQPGAVGKIAADFVKNQNNPRTMLFTSNTTTLRAPLHDGFVPIAPIVTFDYVVAIRRQNMPGQDIELPQSSVTKYFDAARKDARLRTVATPGTGGFPHLIAAKLFREHNVPLVHVPYQGGPLAITSLLGGHVTLAVVPFVDFLPHANSQSGLQILARTGRGIDETGWLGIIGPKGTREDEAKELESIFRVACENSREKFLMLGYQANCGSQDELAALAKKTYDFGTSELDRLGIRN